MKIKKKAFYNNADNINKANNANNTNSYNNKINKYYISREP